MNIKEMRKQLERKGDIPTELIGYWRAYGNRYEFRDDGRYYVWALNKPYQLIESGMVLVYSGIRYERVYGEPSELIGVWVLEDDPAEEWYLRHDGTYNIHWSDEEYFGEYSYNDTEITSCEMACLYNNSSGVLTIDPPYSPILEATWTLDEPYLTIIDPFGTTVYSRETID
ncbi:MAG: hypothetical protein GY702_06520 [Desulfobulbaceae bacterium]|nr:hypothetical protein [Desulfobulbaceae bacterium]